MLTAFRAFDAGTAKPTDEVTLLPGDITEGAPVLGDAHSGQRWQIGDLLDAMIMYSDNIASNGLMSHFGLDTINATIRKAGMTGTVLARHFAGIVPPGRANLNVTTPGDIALLLYQIERGSHEGVATLASPASCRAMIDLMLHQEYREMIPAGITRKVPIANKTGELDYVRSDAAIVDPNGESPYVLVILTKELDYPGLAYPDIAAIAKRIDTGMRRIASL
jgi:beta-lactamase class A